jgi:hypothetical protein
VTHPPSPDSSSGYQYQANPESSGIGQNKKSIGSQRMPPPDAMPRYPVDPRGMWSISESPPVACMMIFSHEPYIGRAMSLSHTGSASVTHPYTPSFTPVAKHPYVQASTNSLQAARYGNPVPNSSILATPRAGKFNRTPFVTSQREF